MGPSVEERRKENLLPSAEPGPRRIVLAKVDGSVNKRPCFSFDSSALYRYHRT